MTATSQLPNQLSALIRVAVADLAKVEKDKRYRVDMRVWHYPIDGRCSVCLAGAVLAKSLHTKITARTNSLRIKSDLGAKMRAVNSVRVGLLRYAVTEFYGPLTILTNDLPFHIPAIEYTYRNRGRFKRWLLDCADTLEKAGF